ncbi:type II secretion system F family protein [Nocardioides sp. JQ2195]|uniref:type II secretion system F family protein n=1 Tax=Nocardioides sp. JQ2195 TaxID=2592334 RepID=UPI00143E55E7|nr:type II secretion system F family protein [Nocardioides sp. JQ2195]QIX27813.1 type II secretion system F family protein [Nocardioides sp. JQ2195]
MSSTLILLLGGLLLFSAFALTLSVIGVATAERRAVGRSLAAVQAIDQAPDILREELERPFSERVIAPLGEKLVGIGRKLTRADTADRIRHKLDIAGNPQGWDVNRIIGLKVLGMGVFGLLTFLYMLGNGSAFSKTVLITVGVGALGYLLPNILVHNAGQKRESLMLNALPDALDLLTISVEAGLGFDAAVARVAKNTTGPLAQEFARLLQEMQIGVGRMEAMRSMGERTSIKDLKSFCLSMVQADQLGIPIARVLRVQSSEMRTKRRQRAEEAAQKVPVKILFPLIFFILPCLFIVVIGPVILQARGAFG